jgi:hypothetical protein
MHHSIFRKILCVLLFSLPMHLVLGQADWKKIVDKEGIKVFTKSVPTSKIKVVKVDCILNTTPAALVALLLDVESSVDWVTNTKSCKLIKKVSSSELFYYSEVTLPWPLENRDFVAHLKVSQNPVSKVIKINGPAVPGFIQEKKNVVRITQSVGDWVITPLADHQVHVEYILQVDPGGVIPAWAVNVVSTQTPIKIFQNMRKQLLLAPYKNASLHFIQ